MKHKHDILEKVRPLLEKIAALDVERDWDEKQQSYSNHKRVFTREEIVMAQELVEGYST